MGARARLAAIAAATVLLAVGCQTVGASGGTFVLVKDRVTIVVPAGAVASDVVAYAKAVPAPIGGTGLVPGTAWDVSPAEGWSAPVTLRLRYRPADIPSGTAPTDLRLYRGTVSGTGTTWSLVPGSTVDTGTSTVSAAVSNLGRFAIGAAVPASLSIDAGSGTLPIRTVTPTETWDPLALDATVTDAEGRALSTPVTWSSDDPGIVTVDGSGTATAVARGTGTVRASVGAIAGTAPVCVGGTPVGIDRRPDRTTLPAGGVTFFAWTQPSCGQADAPVTFRWQCLDLNVTEEPCLTATGADATDLTRPGTWGPLPDFVTGDRASDELVLDLQPLRSYEITVRACIGSVCTAPNTLTADVAGIPG